MEWMCTQTRLWFTLSSERVFLGNRVRTLVNYKEKKSPVPEFSEEGRTPDAASGRIVSPTHYRLSWSGPREQIKVGTIECDGKEWEGGDGGGSQDGMESCVGYVNACGCRDSR